MKRHLVVLLSTLAGVVAPCFAPAALATPFTITNRPAQSIQLVDTSAHTITTVATGLTGQPDSLIFIAPDLLLVSQTFIGLATVNIITGTVTPIGPVPGQNSAQDMVLEPGGHSVLISNTLGGNIYRLNLLTDTFSLFATTPGFDPRGLAYDAAGNLFAVMYNPLNASQDKIEQLNPVTGAVLNTLVVPGLRDGLTYDPFTGDLWAGGAGLLDIPTNLLSFTMYNGGCGAWDGTVSDGAGHIDLASECSSIEQFNIATHAFTSLANTPGIDDLAPVVGPGSNPAVPEPASMVLLGTGLIGIAARRRRNRR